MRKFLLVAMAVVVAVLSSCSHKANRTINYGDAQIVADRIAERYHEEIQCGGVYGPEEAATTLWCYADTNSGMDITEEELREAIWEMLEYYDDTNEFFKEMSSGEMLEDMKNDYGDAE